MKKMISEVICFYCVLFLNSLVAEDKVLIITHSYCRPEFIEWQYKTFKKFIQDNYEFVVFNDATTDVVRESIVSKCKELAIQCIQIPQEIHARPYLPRWNNESLQAANFRHACCIQYSMDVLGFDRDGIVCIIDSDAFFVRPISITEYMKDADIAAYIRTGIRNSVYYISPIICFLKMNKLPDKRTLNFNTGAIDGILVDSGGYTHYYFKQHPEVKVKRILPLFSHQLFLGDSHVNISVASLSDSAKTECYGTMGFNDKEIKFLLKRPDTFDFFLESHMLHYRGASTTANDGSNKKFQIFKEFIDDILQ